MNKNTVTSYAKDNGYNVCMALRIRELLNIGEKLSGYWLITFPEWNQIKKHLDEHRRKK